MHITISLAQIYTFFNTSHNDPVTIDLADSVPELNPIVEPITMAVGVMLENMRITLYRSCLCLRSIDQSLTLGLIDIRPR